MSDQLVANLSAELEKVKALGEAYKQQIDIISSNADQFFLITMALIIYFMQCGFAFLECGSVRSKSATNILIKNLLDSFVAGVAYWLIGYGLAFGEGNPFCGEIFWATSYLPDEKFAHWFFHFVFAATAATIVSGALAERCDFAAYLTYSFVITGIVYPVVTHWAWEDHGWLLNGGMYMIDDGNGNLTEVNIAYQDFAGSGCVHLLGATAAFIGAAFLGPRLGRFDHEIGTVETIKGHSVPLAALGGFILLFGFFAFNGGSQASISQEGDGAAVAISIMNTVISGSFAAFTALVINKTGITGGNKWSLLVTLNGALTGMVAICAGCNVMYPWSAAIIGVFAAGSYMLWSWLVVKLKIDDPLDAVAVHGGGGLWGVLSVPILEKDIGIVFTWSKQSFLKLGWQLAGLSAIMGWTGVISLLMFGLLKLAKLLRVSEDIEKKGLDIPKHGEAAYPAEAYGHGWGEKGDALRSLMKKSSQANLSIMKGGDQIMRSASTEFEKNRVRENPELQASISKQSLNDTDSGNISIDGENVNNSHINNTTRL